MSFFGKSLFKKKEPVLSTGDTIQKLREVEGMLMKKQDILEEKIEFQLSEAKKNGTKNKRAAIEALKRKKRLEKNLQEIDGQLSTLEMQREALESAKRNVDVMLSMKMANDALKQVHNGMNIDQLHDMMEDISESQEISNEISAAISNPIAFGADYDEDELERELEGLEQAELDSKLTGVNVPAVNLPEVPTNELKDKTKVKKKATAVDDDDLEELASWAN